MKDWTAGYVSEIQYTYGYYSELNPLRVKLAFLNNGLKCPKFVSACELGFGQGISTNIHAASSLTTWVGNDFNPSQAAFAQELANFSESKARLYDDSFADFAIRDDLPDFDYIGLHGIWSWISDVNREIIVEFIKRKLKVGGVLYISYNTQPGWAAMIPMRDLLTEFSSDLGSSGRGITSKIDNALAFVDQLMSTNPKYLKAYPEIIPRLIDIKSKSRNYLAHEYFNKDWDPMTFSEVRKWLEPAKIEFACSANYLDHIDRINLSNDQVDFLKQFDDDMFKQSLRDFMVNQQFRKDYWVKGPRKLTLLEKNEELSALTILLISPVENISLKITGSLGEASMQESIYRPILDQLSDHKPKKIGQIEEKLRDKSINLNQIVEAIMVLSGAGYIACVDPEEPIASKRIRTDKLNAYILVKARSSGEINALASPVISGGIYLGRFQQLCVLAIKRGLKQPNEWALFIEEILNSQGQKIVKEGKTLETKEELLAELMSIANEFASKRMPILKALQIL